MTKWLAIGWIGPSLTADSLFQLMLEALEEGASQQTILSRLAGHDIGERTGGYA